jgi:hypothetical protein
MATPDKAARKFARSMGWCEECAGANGEHEPECSRRHNAHLIAREKPISRDEWLQALTEAELPTDNDPDAITTSDFQKMFGLKRTAAITRLRALVEAGKAVRADKVIIDTMGRRQISSAYKLIKPAPAPVVKKRGPR